MTQATLQALLRAGDLPGSSDEDPVLASLHCLDRFTAAFNACDAAAMDAELHFPHTLLSGGEATVWPTPGRHPAGLFASLKSLGWASTRYEQRTPVLVAADKVHWQLRYSRRRADDSVLSLHDNLWVLVRRDGRWGILWRSY